MIQEFIFQYRVFRKSIISLPFLNHFHHNNSIYKITTPLQWSEGGNLQTDAAQLFLFDPIPAKVKKLGLLSIYKFSLLYYFTTFKKKLILFSLKFAICHLKRSKWDTQGRGGSWFMKKILNRKSHGTVPLNFLLLLQNFTYWKLQILAVMPCQLKLHIFHDYESTGPLPPHTHTCVCDVRICKSGGGDFIRNAAKMFSFGPIPTRTKKAWSSSTCLLYGSR